MANLPGCLSLFLRFCVGAFAGALGAMTTWQTLVPPGGPNYGEGIGYGFTMMFWMFIGGIVCGLLAASSRATRLSNQLLSGQEPDKRLNLVCFLWPLIFGPLLATLFDGGEGLLGYVFCFFSALFALGALLFKPSRKIKQAAWSHIFGFTIALCFFVVGAFFSLSGQQSPWLP